MVLLYTGSQSPDTPQSQPIQSLGGFLSSSPIPNGEVASLFSTISGVIKTGYRDTKMIGLKNNSSLDITNIRIWAISSDPELSISLAAMAPAFDLQCNRYYFEKIQSPSGLPLQAQFNQFTQLAPLVIPTIIANNFIGLWIKVEKVIPITTTTTLQIPVPLATNHGCLESEILLLKQNDLVPLRKIDFTLSIEFV